MEMGCQVSCADTVLRGDQLREGLVPATLTLAEDLGRAVRLARAAHADPVAEATRRPAAVAARGQIHNYRDTSGRRTGGEVE
ncbi:hypothetical protein GCM10023075_74550 [Streptosporangium album]